MIPQFTTGVFSQAFWRGIGTGPLDDCWVLSDLAGVHGCAPWSSLPSVKDYRIAAGNIDTDASDPGTIDHSATAIRKLYPKLAITVVKGDMAWAAFIGHVKNGRAASLSVKAGSLPDHGTFLGDHRVVVYWNGTIFRLLDPLKKPHSFGYEITEAQIKKASDDHSLSGLRAILFPTVEQAFTTHPLYVTPQPPPVTTTLGPGIYEVKS